MKKKEIINRNEERKKGKQKKQKEKKQRKRTKLKVLWDEINRKKGVEKGRGKKKTVEIKMGEGRKK